MWEFLKSNARKERERLEEEQKQLEIEQFETVYNETIKTLNEKIRIKNEKYYETETKRIIDENSICPKCKSTKVVDKISQLKGEINGSSSGSGYTSIFGGSYHSSGSIRGSIDTLEINKCNECGNEWKKTHYNHFGTTSFDTKLRYLRHSVEFFVKDEDANESYLVKEAREFWSGVRIDIMKEIVHRTYYSSYGLNEYKINQMDETFNGQDDILVNKLGLIK